MDVLAGRKSVGRVSASRLVNGCEIDSSTFKQLTAYVSQEDVFHPTATVQEAIMFQAHLKYVIIACGQLEENLWI
jgi:ABC-type multidrug transport system ATPase subunit